MNLCIQKPSKNLRSKGSHSFNNFMEINPSISLQISNQTIFKWYSILYYFQLLSYLQLTIRKKAKMKTTILWNNSGNWNHKINWGKPLYWKAPILSQHPQNIYQNGVFLIYFRLGNNSVYYHFQNEFNYIFIAYSFCCPSLWNYENISRAVKSEFLWIERVRDQYLL